MLFASGWAPTSTHLAAKLDRWLAPARIARVRPRPTSRGEKGRLSRLDDAIAEALS